MSSVTGKRIYLDYNATTPLAPSVYEKICLGLKDWWANPSSDSEDGRKAKEQIHIAREKLALMIQARTNEIIFTSGGTEANNMAILSAVREAKKMIKDKPHVITTKIEHDATLKVVSNLEMKGEIELTKIGVDKNSNLTASDVLNAVKPNTCLITIMLANNETGVIFPVREITWGIKTKNLERRSLGQPLVLVHADAAQAIGKIPVSVRHLNLDYMTIVGHKFYGPRIGCLYRSTKAPLTPLMFGGGQEAGMRPGTENTALIAGLGEAANIVIQHLDKISLYMNNIRNYLETKLSETFGDQIVLNFTSSPRLPNTTSVTFLNVRAEDVLAECKKTVASAGAACHSNSSTPSRVLLECLSSSRLAGRTIRLSVGRETTKQDIDEAVQDLHNAVKSAVPCLDLL